MTPKRPRDPNQLGKSIIDITTGQKPDRDLTPEEQGKDSAAVAMGKKGGKAHARLYSPAQSGFLTNEYRATTRKARMAYGVDSTIR